MVKEFYLEKAENLKQAIQLLAHTPNATSRLSSIISSLGYELDDTKRQIRLNLTEAKDKGADIEPYAARYAAIFNMEFREFRPIKGGVI